MEGFSEYEIKKSTITFPGEAAILAGCVGKLSHELNVKTVTKSCEGAVAKSRTMGAGDGTVTVTLHMQKAVFRKMFGMARNNLKSGVYAYGKPSRHPEFCYTALVRDEDGNEKYIAYPRCCASSAPPREIENGAEEIAEIEVTLAVMPDDNEEAMYEALAADLDTATKNAWLNSFTPLLVSGVSTYAVAMTVSPATAKVTIVDSEGVSVGHCAVAPSGAVTVPALKDGTYTYVVYAADYTPETDTIEVDGASPSAISVTLTAAD